MPALWAVISLHGGCTSSLRKRQLRELFRAVDEIATKPDLSIEENRGRESKGNLSIVDRGFILHAYVSGQTVDFLIYGPFPPGTEQAPRPPWESPGHAGLIGLDCLGI